jgi:hypothetical protein
VSHPSSKMRKAHPLSAAVSAGSTASRQTNPCRACARGLARLQRALDSNCARLCAGERQGLLSHLDSGVAAVSSSDGSGIEPNGSLRVLRKTSIS